VLQNFKSIPFKSLITIAVASRRSINQRWPIYDTLGTKRYVFHTPVGV